MTKIASGRTMVSSQSSTTFAKMPLPKATDARAAEGVPGSPRTQILPRPSSRHCCSFVRRERGRAMAMPAIATPTKQPKQDDCAIHCPTMTTNDDDDERLRCRATGDDNVRVLNVVKEKDKSKS
ncbi:hypothetical protein ACHAW5_011248 [Stephanodiscus triporus]|uniref:Uncharacterized protein n=1 Tax=Stephanodiscus triporus TaxID=2934178 RepID=A0ABD3PUG8_9STRA